ncbi:hypothetical protein EDB83DRAFT_2495168 [Lactarius deliciosus]|nr:hypothetical protein EDB83DRAFT_2495168 [Lactarius deliciosus]
MRATRLLCSLSLSAISHGCTTGCIPSGGPERPSPPSGLGYKNHESVQLISGDALNVSGTSEPQQEQNPNQVVFFLPDAQRCRLCCCAT